MKIIKSRLMKKLKLTLLLIVIFMIKFNGIFAQCTDFVTNTGFQILDTAKYVPEGRFDAMTLSEGDYLKVYKSFFRGKTYRIAVFADKNFSELKFQVKSMKGNLIYDNSNAENQETWEYVSDKNQNLIIKIELPPAQNLKPKSGCVAVILGYKF